MIPRKSRVRGDMGQDEMSVEDIPLNLFFTALF